MADLVQVVGLQKLKEQYHAMVLRMIAGRVELEQSGDDQDSGIDKS